MDAVATIWEEEGFPDEPLSGITDDPNDYAYLGAKYFVFSPLLPSKNIQTNIFFSCFEGMRGERTKYFAP